MRIVAVQRIAPSRQGLPHCVGRRSRRLGPSAHGHRGEAGLRIEFTAGDHPVERHRPADGAPVMRDCGS